MDRNEVKGRVARGLAWVGAASSVVGVLDTVGNFLILALWIRPEQQGLAAAALWLFPILDMIIDGGLSSAIIQRDDVSPRRLSTIFWINLALSCVAAAALQPAATAIVGSAAAAPLLRVYGAKLLLQNVFFVPQAMMRRELRFKELSVIRVAANLVGFSCKIAAAAAGAGAWCYVIGNFAHSIITAAGIQLRQPFRPRFVLALREAFADVRFGLTTAAREILFNFYSNVDCRVVIAFFGAEANGLYYFATATLLQPVRFLSLIVIEVAFPAFSRLRHDRARTIDQFVSFTRMNLVVVLPYVALIALAGEDFVRVIFGATWMPATTAMRLICVVGVLRALSFIMPPLLEGMGKPRRSLVYAACASVIMPALYIGSALLLGPRLGWLSVALAWVVGYPLVFAVLCGLALATIGLSAREYLRRTIGIPLCVAAAAAVAGVARLLAAPLGPGARLAVTATCLLGLTAVLVARFQGIRLGALVAALRRG